MGRPDSDKYARNEALTKVRLRKGRSSVSRHVLIQSKDDLNTQGQSADTYHAMYCVLSYATTGFRPQGQTLTDTPLCWLI